MNPFLEAIYVGIFLSGLGTVVMKFLRDTSTPLRPGGARRMAFVFFVCGFLSHLILELTGVNAWYVASKCSSR